MANQITKISSAEEFKNALKSSEIIKVLNFWAPWSDQCTQMNKFLIELSTKYSSSNQKVAFLQIEAEEIYEISVFFNISAVPTFIILDNAEKEVARVEGANPTVLAKAIEKALRKAQANPQLNELNVKSGITSSAKEPTDLNTRLKNLTQMSKCVLFMKGSPDDPQCGFSRQILEILKERNIEFTYFDILQDEEVRQGLKEYAQWPTYPQLWLNGELVGGLDIVREMVDNGEFQSMFGVVKDGEKLEELLKELISREKVMIFIKGSPDAPQCGFSRQLIEILDDLEVKYGYFDILQDEKVRQGLKDYAQWPTYPQVWINGELVGGLDIVREMVDNGEFQSMI